MTEWTRNQPFLLKSETNTRLLSSLIAPSAKQHLIMLAPKKSKYPRIVGRPGLLCKKVKGISRTRHDSITYMDFINVAVHRMPARKVTTGRFQKNQYQIFVVQNQKKCLSHLSTKRVYSSDFKTPTSFYSLPLSWKSRYVT